MAHWKGAILVYETGEIKEVNVPLGNSSLVVPASFVEAEELDSIFDGEKYAGTFGGMFFISNRLPEQYHRFAAFHEMAEHAAPRRFDETGLAVHIQALALELAYAKVTLSIDEFRNYYDWRKNVENSGFFKWKDEEGVVDGAAVRIKDIFSNMSRYVIYRRKPLVRLVEG